MTRQEALVVYVFILRCDLMQQIDDPKEDIIHQLSQCE